MLRVIVIFTSIVIRYYLRFTLFATAGLKLAHTAEGDSCRIFGISPEVISCIFVEIIINVQANAKVFPFNDITIADHTYISLPPIYIIQIIFIFTVIEPVLNDFVAAIIIDFSSQTNIIIPYISRICIHNGFFGSQSHTHTSG